MKIKIYGTHEALPRSAFGQMRVAACLVCKRLTRPKLFTSNQDSLQNIDLALQRDCLVDCHFLHAFGVFGFIYHRKPRLHHFIPHDCMKRTYSTMNVDAALDKPAEETAAITSNGGQDDLDRSEKRKKKHYAKQKEKRRQQRAQSEQHSTLNGMNILPFSRAYCRME